jgi:hypothetical protein
VDASFPGSRAGTVRSVSTDEPSRAEYGEQLRELSFRDGSGARENSVGNDVPAETKPADYWREVPRLERDAAELRQRYPPDAQTAKPHTSDAPSQPDSRPAVDLKDAIDQVRRNETAITADIGKIAAGNTCGLWLEGLDCRLKGESRLSEKISNVIRGNPDASPDQVTRDIPDAIRYTFCSDTASYTAGFADVRQRLEQCGYEMYQCRNSWGNAEYKGINTRWVTPDGQRFEVQFHTTESFHAKHHLTHWAYEQLRQPSDTVSRAQRQELKTFQQDVASYIEIPGGAIDIADYHKKDT